ncbi:transcriptional regulator [Desulfurococcus amylolyticus]|uniref:Transcription regulator containing HTH domain n=1 Tax=Desulfurococcus amylolyticus DSM 16532 TaxID=768672 RepID=I3XS65_DESAM|nr:transcriptional regulator [Desulfurococcus amylolyticus]AFL66789.1 transcription regulator containing HTH domain [Desulfurococcus amylolyticus DSM 16532]
MSRDQVIGWGLLAVSVIVVLIYAYILFFTPYSGLLMQLTLLIAVAGVFGVLGWIGYTLATTPPPKPIEEIEKEIEEELKKLEEETKKESSGPQSQSN